RYTLSRIRLGQFLLPFATVANVLVRRAPSVVSTTFAILSMGGALVALVSAFSTSADSPSCLNTAL
ncbi:MAG TPA: hypothetical protein VHZ95_06845, partial [Polyangiales bacterium]|nr:hypothetical protein [Polyangiales bacterium]